MPTESSPTRTALSQRGPRHLPQEDSPHPSTVVQCERRRPRGSPSRRIPVRTRWSRRTKREILSPPRFPYSTRRGRRPSRSLCAAQHHFRRAPQWETRGLPSLNATLHKAHTTPQTGDERTPSRDPPLNLTASCGHPQPPSWDLYYSHTINLYIYLLQSRR